MKYRKIRNKNLSGKSRRILGCRIARTCPLAEAVEELNSLAKNVIRVDLAKCRRLVNSIGFD